MYETQANKNKYMNIAYTPKVYVSMWVGFVQHVKIIKWSYFLSILGHTPRFETLKPVRQRKLRSQNMRPWNCSLHRRHGSKRSRKKRLRGQYISCRVITIDEQLIKNNISIINECIDTPQNRWRDGTEHPNFCWATKITKVLLTCGVSVASLQVCLCNINGSSKIVIDCFVFCSCVSECSWVFNGRLDTVTDCVIHWACLHTHIVHLTELLSRKVLFEGRNCVVMLRMIVTKCWIAQSTNSKSARVMQMQGVYLSV